MNIRRIKAVALREWREMYRDKLFFTLAFLIPLLLMLVFNYGLSMDVDNLALGVLDHDRTALSRDYARRFMDSRYFSYRGHVADEAQAGRLLVRGALRAVLVIPAGFQKDLSRGRVARTQFLIDGTFPFRAQTTKGYLEGISGAFSLERASLALAKARGTTPARAEAALLPVRVQTRYLYNQSLRSRWSMAPKLMMLVLMICPPLLTALGVVREKETGAILNVYSSTLGRGEYLAGKLLPYVLVSFLNAALLWAVAHYWFGSPFRGAAGFFALACACYILCTTGIGLIVSVLVRTQVTATLVVFIVTAVSAMMYSGIFVPLSSLGSGAQVTAYMLPGIYFTNIILGSFLKGSGPASLWPDTLALVGYAAALLGAGWLLFTKRPRR